MPLLLFKLESIKSEPNAKGRPARLWINSDSALPLGGVARSAENRNDYDTLSFNRKVDGVGQSASQRAANS